MSCGVEEGAASALQGTKHSVIKPGDLQLNHSTKFYPYLQFLYP